MGTFTVMVRYVLRVWIPDHPGSLGTLATCIGEAGADLVGIDILERDGARAVDELTVEMPDGVAGDLLVEAIAELPGMDVEDIREVVSRIPYAGADVLDVAVSLTECTTCSELEGALSHGVCSVFSCDWAAVVELTAAGVSVVASAGAAPSAGWLGAFVAGASAGQATRSNGGLAGPRDVAWAALDSADLIVLAGRDGPPFRTRERRQLHQLCRIADSRWRDFVLASLKSAHPSATARSEMAVTGRLRRSLGAGDGLGGLGGLGAPISLFKAVT
jgi:ACT domain-containing protein